jgi:hypothetical protein
MSNNPAQVIRGLDKNQYVAAVLMDLSNAFDCLPHDILLDKLSAYGMSNDYKSSCFCQKSSSQPQVPEIYLD